MENEEFEVFAKKLCEYCMKNYVIPYLQDNGYIRSYRAEVKSVNGAAGTMNVQRPFDNEVTLPFATQAASLMAGRQCVVLAPGDGSNAIVFSDGKLDV